MMRMLRKAMNESTPKSNSDNIYVQISQFPSYERGIGRLTLFGGVSFIASYQHIPKGMVR